MPSMYPPPSPSSPYSLASTMSPPSNFNPYIPQPSYIPPVSNSNGMPNMQDADKAFKLYGWYNNSGLTAEELDALSELKKKGTDVGKLLGISNSKPASNDDVLELKNDVKNLKDIVSSLINELTGNQNKKEDEKK